MNSQNELLKKVNDKVLINPHYNVSFLHNKMLDIVEGKISNWVWEELWHGTRGIFAAKMNVENLTNEHLNVYEFSNKRNPLK
jgi:hypothetical protein